MKEQCYECQIADAVVSVNRVDEPYEAPLVCHECCDLIYTNAEDVVSMVVCEEGFDFDPHPKPPSDIA